MFTGDVTENMFICINRICCLIERRKCKPDYYLDTYYYLEPKYVAFNLCKKFGKMSLIKIIINPAYSANFMISSSHDEDCCLCLFSDTAVLRHILLKKKEPEVSLRFLDTSYIWQHRISNKKMICGAHW